MAQALALLLPASPLPRSPASTRNPRLFPRRNRLRPLPAASPRNWSTPPETDCPVPPDQQPVNEYQSLSTSLPFSWATAALPDYAARLAVTGAAFALFIGLPVAAFGSGAIRDPQEYGLRCALGATSAGLLAVTLAVLRMYLGWAYVGNRLLSATVEYEETGWYDGQIWVKTPEVLARDRLLGSFSVKPVLSRVKYTLVGLAVSLVLCVLLFINIESSREQSRIYGERSVTGVYKESSARSFEADAFCGEADLS